MSTASLEQALIFDRTGAAKERSIVPACGRVEAVDGSFGYSATLTNEVGSCAPESLDEFLLERYTAFTQSGNRRRFFRIWHEPWQQVAAKVEIVTDDLIRAAGSWWRAAACVGANFSPGLNVWMGWPHRIRHIC
jgi:uncharacterized protein